MSTDAPRPACWAAADFGLHEEVDPAPRDPAFVAERRQPEIDDGHGSVARDEHVARVDVAVQHAAPVDVGVRRDDPLAELEQPSRPSAGGSRRSSAAAEFCVGAGMPADDQVGAAVRLPDLDQARGDASIERTQDPGFVPEQRGALRARPADLQGDVAPLLVAREVELRVDHDLDGMDDPEPADRRPLGQHGRLDQLGERRIGRDQEPIGEEVLEHRVRALEGLARVELAFAGEPEDRIDDPGRRPERAEQERGVGVDDARGRAGSRSGDRVVALVVGELSPDVLGQLLDRCQLDVGRQQHRVGDRHGALSPAPRRRRCEDPAPSSTVSTPSSWRRARATCHASPPASGARPRRSSERR